MQSLKVTEVICSLPVVNGKVRSLVKRVEYLNKTFCGNFSFDEKSFPIDYGC